MNGWSRAENLHLLSIGVTLIVGVLAAAAVVIGRQNHTMMNSRFSEMLQLKGEASEAKGLKQGRDERNNQ